MTTGVSRRPRWPWPSVLVWVVCACGALNLAADGGLDVAVAPGRVLSDDDGPLREIVLHFVAEYADDLDPLYADLFTALPVDVDVDVLCESAALVERFERDWGEPERARGRMIDVINLDRPLTVWARDRRIARAGAFDDSPAPSLLPQSAVDYGLEHEDDLLVPLLLESLGYNAPTSEIAIQLEGGNVVANDRHAFLGANVISDNASLGLTGWQVKRELLRALGRPFVLVGDEGGAVPWPHIDMYLTPIDDETVLVARPIPEYAAEINEPLNGSEITRFGATVPEGVEFDLVAEQVRRHGYRVERLPAVVDPAGIWMVTYNNVLMEHRDGRAIVYMPVYGYEHLDELAASVYEGLGFEVHRINVSGVYHDGGAIRCVANVVARGGVPAAAEVVTEETPEDSDAEEVVEDTPDESAAPDETAEDTAERAAVTTAPAVVVPPVGASLGDDAPEPNNPGPKPAGAGATPVASVTEPLADDDEPLPIAGTSVPWYGAWLPLLIFFARITDVSIGTVRLICITRGRRALAVALAFAEVSIWLGSVATVLTNLTNWMNVVAYAGGFTAGNAIGMWIEARLALGAVTVMLISRQRGAELAQRLRDAGQTLTTISGSGRDGEVAICLAVTKRRDVPQVLEIARQIDPEVVSTIEDVRHTSIRPNGGVRPGQNPIAVPRRAWLRLRPRAPRPTGETDRAA